jgi:hypothetical protein
VASADQPEDGENAHCDRQKQCCLELSARLGAEVDCAPVGVNRLGNPERQDCCKRREDDDPASAVDQLRCHHQQAEDHQRLKREQQPAAAIAYRDVAQAPDQEAATQDAGAARQ